eukprot:gene5222-5459_t
MALTTRFSARVNAPRVAVRSSVRPVLPKVAVRATPEKTAVETAIKEAEEKCADGTAGECAAAWDNVEEISAAISHKKVAEAESSDPLEKFCDDNPDADECRVYDE